MLIGLVAADVLLAVALGRRHWFDVRIYHGAIRYWLHGGQIYDYAISGSNFGFTYPPVAAICMLPMALVSRKVTIASSVVLNLAAATAILYWLVEPLARRYGWSRWLALGVAGGLLAVYDPVRDTISFGQINLILLAMVLADLRFLVDPGRKVAGIGVGLAAAIKLTPAVFIGYLLLGRRRSAGLVAAATAAGATGIAAVAAPHTSRTFWLDALWRVGRVGNPASVSNQSLLGFVARFDPARPDRLLWTAMVALVACVWAWRVRRAAAAGDHAYGAGLTCIVMCLVSPITWVHHLVWLIPPLVLFVDACLRDGPFHRRRPALLGVAIAGYAILASGAVWLWRIAPTPTTGPPNVGSFVGSNLDLWAVLAFFCCLPMKREQDLLGAGD